MPSARYSQKEKFETARFELHQLLAQPSLTAVPLLVVSVPYMVSPEHSTIGYQITCSSLVTRTTFRAMPPYKNLSRHCKPPLCWT